jgi:peptidoglycan/LPS O-acetylase OafA/YrhL
VLLTTFAVNRLTPSGYFFLRPLRNMLIIGLLAALLVGALTAGPATLLGRVFRTPSLRFLGKYSYGLYVFHHFFSYWLVRHDADGTFFGWVGSHTLALLLRTVVGSILSIAIAVASYHLFEKRALALKRLWPSAPGS